MKKAAILLYITLLHFCTVAWAQSPLDSLQNIQQSLNHTQDSLQKELTTARSLFGGAAAEAKDSISVIIVELESALFDTRSQLGRVGSEISAAQVEAAQVQISQSSNQGDGNITELHQSSKLTENLSKKDIEILVQGAATEAMAEQAIMKITPLYRRLVEIKNTYDTSMNQDEVDALLIEAQELSKEIQEIDSQAGKKWLDYYNHALGLYLVMLDMSPGSDRALLEAIDNKGREVRRAETFIQQGALTPMLSPFTLQRDLLHSYQKAIAQAEGLDKVYTTFDAKQSKEIASDFPSMEFETRVLTLYAPVERNFAHPFSEVDSIPQIIIPTRGVYYTVRIALMDNPAKSLKSLGSVGPLQLLKTDKGKYSYQVGGFKTYEDAEEGLKVVKNARYRAPVIIAYLNGEVTTTKKAREAEKEMPELKDGEFKVVVKTKINAVGEIVKESAEIHAKGTSVLRMVDGEDITFSVQTFTNREEAAVFAQILKESTKEENVSVVEIPAADVKDEE